MWTKFFFFIKSKFGTVVTIGGMSRKPILIPTGAMIFKELQFKGFWMTNWINSASSNARDTMINDIAKLIKDGKLKLWYESVPLDSYKESISRCMESRKDCKLVFKLD